MNDNERKYVSLEEWYKEYALECELANPDDFLKIKETTTRIGIPSYNKKELYQTCHILHKRGKYYIVHFKELFALDGKSVDISDSDVDRRNVIAKLLEDWGLVELKEKITVNNNVRHSIKILPFSEKDNWTLMPKYVIGNK